MDTHHHPDHSAMAKRLNRIEGQVAGVNKMISERRYCLDILAQTRAIQSALKSVEAEILRSHLAHCVRDALTADDDKEIEQKLDEIVRIFKRDQ